MAGKFLTQLWGVNDHLIISTHIPIFLIVKTTNQIINHQPSSVLSPSWISIYFKHQPQSNYIIFFQISIINPQLKLPIINPQPATQNGLGFARGHPQAAHGRQRALQWQAPLGRGHVSQADAGGLDEVGWCLESLVNIQTTMENHHF